MARLGDTINPALFVNDYSGFTDAASIRAAGLMNFGNQISGAVKDYAKEQKDAKNTVKASAAQIKAAAELFPNLAPSLEPLGQELANEDLPISERAALAQAIPSVLKMGIDRETGKEDLAIRLQGLGLQERNFNLQQQESALRQQATGFEIASAVQNQEIDELTKSTLGPALLEQTLEIAPKGMAEDIRKNIGDLSPAEQYATANSIRSLLPKSTQAKAPTIAEVAIPGGKQQLQWDPVQGWIPIQVGGLNPTGGVGDVGSGIEPPPDILLPDGSADSGVGVDGQAGVLPPRVGFSPTPRDDKAAMQAEKLKAENLKVQQAKQASIAKSQQLIQDLDNLEKHPGFNGVFGVGIGARKFPGTDAANADTLLKKIEGSGFLESVQALKGMGALTEQEGAKLQASFLGLSPQMSEKAAKAQIQQLKKTVQENINRIQGEQTAPAAELTPAQKGLSILQGLTPR